MYLFLFVPLFRDNTVPCSAPLVKGLNRELGRGLTHYQLVLLVFTASWWVDLTVFIASHLTPHSLLENKHGCAGPRKGTVPSEKIQKVLWLNSTFLLVCGNNAGCCTRKQNPNTNEEMRNIALPVLNALSGIFLSLIGRPCTIIHLLPLNDGRFFVWIPS